MCLTSSRLFELLKELNADGLTVICVLHDLNLALTYFNRLLVLSQGGVAAWGPAEEALSPEVLEAVYGVRAHVHHHAGRTYLTFSPRAPRQAGGRGRVHLVCGGGTGSSLMRELTDRGYEVSAGVLNALDSDEVTGRELGLSMAVEAPFSPDRRRRPRREPAADDRRRRRRARRRAPRPRQRPQPRRRAGRRAGAARRSGWRRPSATTTPAASPTALSGASLRRYGDEREVLAGPRRMAGRRRSEAERLEPGGAWPTDSLPRPERPPHRRGAG